MSIELFQFARVFLALGLAFSFCGRGFFLSVDAEGDDEDDDDDEDDEEEDDDEDDEEDDDDENES